MVDEEAGGIVETWNAGIVRVRLAVRPRILGGGLKNVHASHIGLRERHWCSSGLFSSFGYAFPLAVHASTHCIIFTSILFIVIGGSFSLGS